jgi:hypothetical protein
MSRWPGVALTIAAAAIVSSAEVTSQRRAAPARPAPQSAAPAAALPPAPSPRNANYSIDVELDPASRAITGRGVVSWRNISARPATELQFHLYWNAWRNTHSTWMRERLRAGRGPGGRRGDAPGRRSRDDWSYIDVTAIRLVAGGGAPLTDLTASGRFIAPDDGNTEDRTVLAVPLPRAVAPGETVTVELAWTAHVPRTFARTGAVGNYFFIAQWFPKLGVLEDTGWNTHQFHAGTEFFSDYGVYDVRITVPRGWVVGATGRERSRQDTPKGATTHRYVQEDVHDFAWTTSPDYLVRTATFEHPRLPATELRLLLQPEHAGQADRHFAATRAALTHYGEWFGPYPYGHLTIVDPAWQSSAGGMEYPTLFTAGSAWLAPEGAGDPEGVTIHEAGHQFWYGLVGNNEFEHAWLDEGLNTFSTSRAFDAAFGPMYASTRFFGGFIPWVFREARIDRVEMDGLSGYRWSAESDVPATPSWRYFTGTGGAITYLKTALWLHTLERHIGWPRLQRGLSLFFARNRYTHPRPEDLFAALSEGAGRDLTWFFDQVYRSSNTFDYAVQQLTTTASGPRGWVDGPNQRRFAEGTPRGTSWRTEVVVRRLGEAVFPVDVLVRFADGSTARERWDGRDRWKLLVYDRASAAVSAEVDPDHVLLLDVNRTNNSHTLAPRARAAGRQWAGRWWLWLQDLVITYGAFL